MFWRIVGQTFRRRRGKTAIVLLAVTLGAALTTALLSISVDVTDRLSREMRAYGANILVAPREGKEALGYAPQAYLDEDDLKAIKTIFWRNNIVGFAPYLSTVATMGDGVTAALTGVWFDKEIALPAGTTVTTGVGQVERLTGTSFKVGVKGIAPWWRVRGDWAVDTNEEGVMVGNSLARRLRVAPGDRLPVRVGEASREFVVRGIVTTGGLEEGQVFAPLSAVQQLLGVERAVDRVLVSALVEPREKLPADIRNKRPEEMTPKEYEKWYCSPIIESVLVQLQEALPGAEAKAIRQVSEAEGAFASKIQLMVLLVTGVALGASSVGVMTTLTAAVIERRPEIGLMKALGADNGQVALIFLTEAGVLGLGGGAAGYLIGWALAHVISSGVFRSPVAPSSAILALALTLGMGVALAGSILPVRRALAVQPVELLRGR
ncbi:MAG: ABC transporter permease [Chloroflexi bacterium]|nr:ABC transporter permease [Chloroflexota bacterium]